MSGEDEPSIGGTAEEVAEDSGTYVSPQEQALEELAEHPIFGPFFQTVLNARQAAESGGNSGGGENYGTFEFSVEEMRTLHARFDQDVEHLLTMAERHQEVIENLEPLASDKASWDHYMAAVRHNNALRTAITQQLEFATGFRDAIGDTIGLREEDETSAEEIFNKYQNASFGGGMVYAV